MRTVEQSQSVVPNFITNNQIESDETHLVLRIEWDRIATMLAESIEFQQRFDRMFPGKETL